MPRYFLELAYKGTTFHGFQIQENAHTVQSAIEQAMLTLYREPIALTGSSRTDAGVHARQNYFHFDTDLPIHSKHIYNLNAILPATISIQSLKQVADTAHCRFDAIAREYQYYIYQYKDPFMQDRGWYYPFELDIGLLQQAATLLKEYTDFTSFAKRNAQVFTHNCNIEKSQWEKTEESHYIYTVRANRFLRGMVRGLVGTMLKVGRKQIGVEVLRSIIAAKDCTKADFSTPPQGLFLSKVIFS